MGIIVEELQKLYAAYREGRPADLPPIGMSYTDTVKRRSEALEGKKGDELWAYWRKGFEWRSAFPGPSDRTFRDLPCRVCRGIPARSLLTKSAAGQLKSLARSEGVTFFTVLLAAFQVLLMRYSGKHDILVGAPMAARSDTEFERVVGYFVNSVVIRGDLSGEPSFRAIPSEAS